MSLKETYIQYGVPSNWANEYEIKGISVSTFKNTTNKNLFEKYSIAKDEIKFVKTCLVRQPINDGVVQKLLEKSRFVCCLCKGQKSDAYIIHHITEYSISKNNDYENLAVLCPNDHDLAHREGIALTSKISEKQIRMAKANWEKQVILENSKLATKKTKLKKEQDWRKANPYRELQSYSEYDCDDFFGRESEVDELLIKINKYNIVGLFGESGTGKTSLVNAGLIPHFKKEEFIVASVRCLDEPVKRIRESIIRELKERKISNQLVEELANVDTFPRLITSLKALLIKEGHSLIIIVDQFEELFTRASEIERELLSKGIVEALLSTGTANKICFLFSLREDYIGELWDWAHNYSLEDAWMHQYRIKRLDRLKAFKAIAQPIQRIGVKIDESFIFQLIDELVKIGNGLIYPPYLQIACSVLFEEYKKQEDSLKPILIFGKSLLRDGSNVGSIIADYLSESMLEGLTEEEKLFATNILDLLTGPEGLRSFLSVQEVAKALLISIDNAKHVIEHLIKKKIVHAVVEDDKVLGYELVHDFLSKKFFDKLSPDAQRSKTTIEIFRKAFREFRQHGVLASKDRLEILLPDIKSLNLEYNEWFFLIKSSFSVYWYFENKWTAAIDYEILSKICFGLISDKDQRIIENAISTLGRSREKKLTPTLIKIIESSETTTAIKDTAIHQFQFNITDKRIIEVLERIIRDDKSPKLRKTAVYAFGRNIADLSKSNKDLIAQKIDVIVVALNDSMTNVRKQAADVLAYLVFGEKAIKPLLDRLRIENSIMSRKAIVSTLASFSRRGVSAPIVNPVLKMISL